MKQIVKCLVMVVLGTLVLPAQASRYTELVRDLESRLASLNYDVGPVDGIFDEKLRAAVKEFQKKVGLRSTGELGLLTQKKIREAAPAISATRPELVAPAVETAAAPKPAPVAAAPVPAPAVAAPAKPAVPVAAAPVVAPAPILSVPAAVVAAAAGASKAIPANSSPVAVPAPAPVVATPESRAARQAMLAKQAARPAPQPSVPVAAPIAPAAAVPAPIPAPGLAPAPNLATPAPAVPSGWKPPQQSAAASAPAPVTAPAPTSSAAPAPANTGDMRFSRSGIQSDWSYAEIGAMYGDLDISARNNVGDSIGAEVDGQLNLRVAGAYQLNKWLFLGGRFEQSKYEFGLEIDRAVLGIGFLGNGWIPRFTPYAILAMDYLDANFDADPLEDGPGFSATLGGRLSITDSILLDTNVGYIRSGDFDGIDWSVAGEYRIAPKALGIRMFVQSRDVTGDALGVELDIETLDYGIAVRRYFSF